MARLGKNSQPVCAFCGRPADENRRVIRSPNDEVCICEHCIAACQTILNDEAHNIAPIDMSTVPTPKEFKDYLDQYVIGQDYAKKFCQLQFTTTTSSFHFQRKHRLQTT